MATERLIVELDARTQRLDASLISTKKRLDDLDRSVQKNDKDLKSFTKTSFNFSRVALSVGAALSIRQFTAFSDQMQIAENQLKNVTKSTEEFNAVSKELSRIANDTRQSVVELTGVFARFKRAGQDAGFSIKETLDLTESLTKAFKIEGNTTAEVNSVLLQLTQSFRSGRIAGEEFRAVSEGSTLVLQALAKQLGVTVGELKDLAAKGEIKPSDLLAGLKELKPQLDAEFKKLEPTFAEVGAAMGNAFASSYNDSVVDKIASGTKSFLIDVAKAWQDANKEIINEDDIVARLNIIGSELNKLQNGSAGLSRDSRLRIAELTEESRALLDALFEIRKEQVPLFGAGVPISVTEGIEDPRLAQERAFIEAVAELNITGNETAEEALLKQQEIHQALLDSKLISEKEYFRAVNALNMDFSKNQDSSAKFEQKLEVEKLSTRQKAINAGMAINNAFFDDNKAIAAGLIVADTATGIQKSLAINPYDYVNVGIIAATGLANLANALGASKGGGSVSSSSGGSPQTPQQQNFEPETTGLQLTEQSESGVSIQRLIISLDDGTDLFDGIASGMEERNRQGR